MPRGKNKITLAREADIRAGIATVGFVTFKEPKSEVARYRHVIKGLQDEYGPEYGLVLTYDGTFIRVEKVEAGLIHRGRERKPKVVKVVHPAGEYEVGDVVEHVEPLAELNTDGVFKVKRIYENKAGDVEATCWGGPNGSEMWRTFYQDKLRRVS